MKTEWITPFLQATVMVFSTTLSCNLGRGIPKVKVGCQPCHEVSGIIRLEGNVHGMVVLSLSREAAFAATELMMGTKPLSINADVADVIGEITNMVAGSAKAKLEELKMSIGLPKVLAGRYHAIAFPPHSTVISIPFESPWGAITVDVGLQEAVVLERSRKA